jgi:hypothetical protein
MEAARGSSTHRVYLICGVESESQALDPASLMLLPLYGQSDVR